MKDRNTQYRLLQSTAMECAFDAWVPGFTSAESYEKPLSFFIGRLIDNASRAGKHLESLTPSHFGSVEESFNLTKQQLGKVSGDVYQTLVHAILWNCCAYVNQAYQGLDISKIPGLPPELLNYKFEKPVGIITLGNNYDLKKLLDKTSANVLQEYEEQLRARNTRLSYSTPDLICISLVNLPEDVQSLFMEPVLNLSSTNQTRLALSRERVEGLIRPSDVVFAAGLKTSIRSDRMYQLLFEANAWKFLWRQVFQAPLSRYFTVVAQTFGADPMKLRSLEFTSVNEGPQGALRVIDGTAQVVSPKDLITWFTSAFQLSEKNLSSETVQQKLFE